MTVLVCLISNQHIPNLLTVKAVSPDNLVLLVTPGMKKKAGWFLKALAAGGLDYSGRANVIDITMENSVDETILTLNAAYAERPEDTWIVNVTGGTKPMSIGAFTFAQEHRLPALYIVESDQQNAIDLAGGSPLNLDGQHVTATEFLSGYGYEIRNPIDLERQNQRAVAWQDLGAMLTEHHHVPAVRDFLGMLQGMKNVTGKKWEKKGLTLSLEDPLWISHEGLRKKICATFGLAEAGRALVGHLDKPAIEFLTGKWLEYFVYGLLLPLVPEKVRCLQIGLTTGLPGQGESNELDVSFMTERSLCMVECKTGSQRHDEKGNDVLYKMEAIKAGLGALRVRAFLATTSPNIIDPDTGTTREALVNRSRLYDCTIINGETLKEWAALFREKDPSLSARVAETFRLKRSDGS